MSYEAPILEIIRFELNTVVLTASVSNSNTKDENTFDKPTSGVGIGGDDDYDPLA